MLERPGPRDQVGDAGVEDQPGICGVVVGDQHHRPLGLGISQFANHVEGFAFG